MFISLILMSNLRFSSMYVYYSLDREGFVEQLCENKDVPELNCDGKCFLAQMLNAQTEDDEPFPQIGWEEVLVFYMELPKVFLFRSDENGLNVFYHKDHYTYSFTDTPLEPPRV